MAAQGPSHGGTTRNFYGWRIVAVAFLVDFIAVGFFFYSFGVFFKSIAADLGGGSRFGVAMGLAVSGGVGALCSPFIGRALDRVSIKRVMIAGAFCVGSGFWLLSWISSPWQYYAILATLFGFGMTMMGGLASAKLVANWFVVRRGTALGIATVGVSLSGLVMPSVATWLIGDLGWRGGFRIYGLATIAIVVPLVARFAVNRPEDIGLVPDGGAPTNSPDGGLPTEVYWRTRDILRSRNFWMIALSFALGLASLSSILTHMVPLADDLGLAPYRAALILSASAGAGAVGKVVFGWLVDRYDARVAVLTSFAGQGVGLLMLMGSASYGALLLAGGVFGFGMGGVIPLHGAVVGAAFGRLSFGKVMGLLRPVQLPLHMAGAPLAGLIYDRTGSYDLAFQIFLGFYVLAAIVICGIRLPRTPEPLDEISGGEAGFA